MPGDLFYVAEKMGAAVSTLVLLDAPLRERLASAFQRDGIFASNLVTGMGPVSDELAERIMSLRDRLTSTPAVGNEGSIAATVGGMSDDEVRDAARELLEISDACQMELHTR